MLYTPYISEAKSCYKTKCNRSPLRKVEMLEENRIMWTRWAEPQIVQIFILDAA